MVGDRRSKYHQMSQLDDSQHTGADSSMLKVNNKRNGQVLEPLKD